MDSHVLFWFVFVLLERETDSISISCHALEHRCLCIQYRRTSSSDDG